MPGEQQGNERLKRRIAMFWGDRERPQRGPRPGLTLDQIARVGIGIADAEGLSAVTMQRLAKQLGFSTMALYRYVASKDDLVALMVDTVAADVPEPDPEQSGWRDLLANWARSMLALFHRHPWVLSANIDGPPEGPNQLTLLERVLVATEDMSIPEDDRTEVALLLSNYVRGFAQVSVGMLAAEKETGVPIEVSMKEYVGHLRNVSEQHYPSLKRSLDSGLFSKDDSDLGDTFEFGLQRILDGIDVYVHSRKLR